ncbi:ATP-binding protein [Gillisia sp. Hel_I_29]|uniref:tetratricopeptide repeat-containing hybrid sensor histidine kinase/response regulator n=1 Tax=Gillisia sp. Hel_I_29 TaxID=1249975 RepID=UPI000552CD44|nr:ATP-binding protein [Gillisia sp. Hel_I_29]
MKKNYFIFLLIILSFSYSYAQSDSSRLACLESIYVEAEEEHKQYDYKEAIEKAMTLLEEASVDGDLYYKYQGNKLLGHSYQDLNDTLRSRKHYVEALGHALNLKNDTILIGAYNDLGNTYSEDKNTTQKGIDYYLKTIELTDKLGMTDKSFSPTLNIAWTYIDNKKYEKAAPYIKRARAIKDEYLPEEENTFIEYISGRYYMGIGELDKAKPYLEYAIAIADKKGLILESSHAYDEYAKLLYSKGEYQEAFLALKKNVELKDKIFENDKIYQIESANARFDVSEYQKDLEVAKKEQLFKDEVIEKSREKMFILIISSLVLIFILMALYFINRSRRKLISELSVKNTELISAKEQAERLTVLKTKFFSTISHELRTPLYGVIGLTSILLEDKSLQKHESDLQSLKFSADYLLALINDVLQMNKMESNLLKLEHLSFNLTDLMNSIVKSFEFTRLQNKNVIHLDFDPAIPKNIIGDPVRLSQILMNLVGNAMKFNERGNIWLKLKLIAEEEDNMVRIHFDIKDDGLGIPENKQQMIFEEFSQLKSSNYNYQGTGLGLPIVKKLLNLFDSDIHLESTEGVGSTFSFEILFEKDVKQEKADSRVLESDIQMQQNAVGKRILVVDDNRINQVVTQRILEQKSFRCEIRDNGIAAVDAIKDEHFDLVLMDLNMPGISGLEATRMIRLFNPVIPIIALTAVEIEEIREEIHEAGMNDIIVKPYDNSTFYQVIYRNIQAEVLT